MSNTTNNIFTSARSARVKMFKDGMQKRYIEYYFTKKISGKFNNTNFTIEVIKNKKLLNNNCDISNAKKEKSQDALMLIVETFSF